MGPVWYSATKMQIIQEPILFICINYSVGIDFEVILSVQIAEIPQLLSHSWTFVS